MSRSAILSACLCDSVANKIVTKNRISIVLEMIKFEHSVFALPFALTGALLAARFSAEHGGPG